MVNGGPSGEPSALFRSWGWGLPLSRLAPRFRQPRRRASIIDAPGVHVGVGERHHHRYYRRHYGGYGAYAADPGHPYGYYHNYGDPRCGVPNYAIQDGVYKPYRGF